MGTQAVEVEGEREESMALGVRTSRSLGALAAALAAAQAEFPAISKDRTANVASRKGEESSYSYAYADLADVLSAVRPILAKHGLATLQPMAWDGSPRLMTCLVHSSGEWIVSEYRLTEYERPQDMGSAITYGRRYALTSLLGIAAEEDDDGGRAQSGRQRARQTMPDCPECHTGERVIRSKFGDGYYCHSCKGKFGAPAAQAEPGPDLSGEEWPNDTTAHERHGLEPPRTTPAKHTSAPNVACPECGKPSGSSKYPKEGKTHYCGACRLSFAPGGAK